MNICFNTTIIYYYINMGNFIQARVDEYYFLSIYYVYFKDILI